MITYTIKKGDTFWKIARNHGIEPKALISANPQITNPSVIYVGQIINIPGTDKSTYTVIKGDTMWGISQKYGVDLNELIKNNPQITNPSLIYPGQMINLPVDATPTTPTTNNLKEMESEVIRLVNNERERMGISPLRENSDLSRVARIKSEDFINNNYFTHNSPIYGTPFEMLNNFKIPFTAAAENIASGQKTPTEVMQTWMNSPGHRSNILNETFNQIGVGVARDNSGTLYWTQLFIRS